MTALLGVEARRYASRRLVRLFGALAVLGILIAGVVVLLRSHRAGAISFQDPRFHLTTVKGVLGGTTVALFLMAWLLGASFIGAEWHAGTMTTLLTWEPRRLRVLAAKAGACLALTFVGYWALQGLLGGLLWLAAATRGTMEGADALWLRQTLGVVLRGGLVVMAGAALGFSLASVGRNTAVALGLAFGYLVVLEGLLSGLLPRWQSWMFVPNAVTFVAGYRGADGIANRTPAEAGVLILAYTVGGLAVASASLRFRDVT